MSKDLINKILEEIGLEPIYSVSEEQIADGSCVDTACPETTSKAISK